MCEFLRRIFRRCVNWCCIRSDSENDPRRQSAFADSLEMHPIRKERDSVFENVELPEAPFQSYPEVQSRKSSEDNSEGCKFQKPQKSVQLQELRKQKSNEDQPGRKTIYRQSTRFASDSELD